MLRSKTGMVVAGLYLAFQLYLLADAVSCLRNHGALIFSDPDYYNRDCLFGSEMFSVLPIPFAGIIYYPIDILRGTRAGVDPIYVSVASFTLNTIVIYIFVAAVSSAYRNLKG